MEDKEYNQVELFENDGKTFIKISKVIQLPEFFKHSEVLKDTLIEGVESSFDVIYKSAKNLIKFLQKV
jgi:hypothetical protein